MPRASQQPASHSDVAFLNNYFGPPGLPLQAVVVQYLPGLSSNWSSDEAPGWLAYNRHPSPGPVARIFASAMVMRLPG
jgi:hypothetical protein